MIIPENANERKESQYNGFYLIIYRYTMKIETFRGTKFYKFITSDLLAERMLLYKTVFF